MNAFRIGSSRLVSSAWTTVAALLSVPAAFAQTPPMYWAPIASSPPARAWSAMAYHTADGSAVLFGGADPVTGNPKNDTWLWNGYAWSQASPSVVPPARSQHAMVYDSVRQRVVMFSTESNNPSATWEWYGGDWHQVITGTWPTTFGGACMAYDAARQQVLSFGGSGFSFSNWTYNGTNWNQVAMFPHPPGRAGGAMCYDAARQRVVLFGGYLTSPLGLANDTWEWDGTTWTQRLPYTNPPARQNHAMVYDSARQVCVMYGGDDGAGGTRADMWDWNGNNWVNRTISNIAILHPSGIARFAMAFDPTYADCVLSGGVNGPLNTVDTWVYGPITPGYVLPFGTGCAGTAGTPGLQTFADTVPWIGAPLEVQVTNIGTNPLVNPALVVLGVSDTTYGAIPLPFDAGAIGMTGCTLYTSIDVLLGTQNLGTGTAWAILLMPLTPTFIGDTIYAQGLEFDAAANSFGMVSSNALQLGIGGVL